jgi:alpha-L-fucosidase
VWNDRWGNDALCKHGSFYTCDDRYQPNDLQPIKWENCFTVDKTSWGFNRNSTQYYSTKELVQTLVATVALNGNFLLNVGPAADGTIPAIFVDRLQGMGQWLQVNGEAIYGTRPWSVAQKVNDTVYYTTKGSTLYAITTKWFNQLVLPDPIPGPKTRIRMLGIEQNLDWFLSNTTNHLVVNVPSLTPDIIPCQHSWAFVLEQLENVDGISKSTLRGMTTTL